jgi:hypothetical protein
VQWFNANVLGTLIESLQHFQREVQENEFGEKDQANIEWIWGKAGVDTAKILQPMQPETACLLRAAYVGEAMLQFCHIDEMRHVEGLPKTIESVNQHASQRDKDLVKIVHEALKRAPWTLTKTYLDKLENGFLVFSGLGLYCGIGEPCCETFADFGFPSFTLNICRAEVCNASWREEPWHTSNLRTTAVFGEDARSIPHFRCRRQHKREKRR